MLFQEGSVAIAPSASAANICSVRSRVEMQTVLSLVTKGLNDCETARRTGIPRETIRGWRTNGIPTGTRARIDRTTVERPLDDRAYSYLLGAYLGDGHIATPGRSCWLRIYMDAKYPAVINECASAMERVLPVKVRRYDRINRGAIVIHASSRNWPCIFPQHGPGRKHLRPIKLELWQRSITHRYPREFLRGLIHSDGSRCLNRFAVALPSGVRRYAYPRYFFTNVSADIRGLFCEHCELVGVHWTRSNWKNISVSHRDSVAILDSFIGPKS